MRRAVIFGLGLAAGLGIGAAGTFALRATSEPPPTYNLRGDILVHGNTALPEVALTFDDGPHAETARGLLDLLGKEDVKATFFVVGKKVEENPALIRRMLNEGHEVGNHTFSHPRLDGMSADEIKKEIAQCGRAVYRATGAGMNLFRPPGMRYDETVIRTAQDLGYVTIHWNAAAKDFQPVKPAVIADRVLSQTQPGSVILLHSHPNTLQALPAIISSLKADGYRFVRVSQMLGRLPRPVYVKTNAYGVNAEHVARVERPPVRSARRERRAPVRANPPSAEEPESPARDAPQIGVDVAAVN